MLNKRQKNMIIKIKKAIEESISVFKASNDVTVCLSYLYKSKDLYSELIKPIDNEKILDSIFKGFCVGK